MQRVFSLLAIAIAISAGVAAIVLASGHDASVENSMAEQVAVQENVESATLAPVALELFTSQGCSSCPPADALVAELVEDPGIVVITRPVTYWDRLGWRDTLGREENTELQRLYATTIPGRNRAYTPQAVVAGRVGMVGSRRSEVTAAIAEAQRRRPAVSIEIAEDQAGDRTVTVEGAISGNAQVRLLALDSSETVNIGRGENSGRAVTYTNVLRAEQTLGDWNGGMQDFTIAAAALNTPEADRHAVVVRQGAGGPILAVRYL